MSGGALVSFAAAACGGRRPVTGSRPRPGRRPSALVTFAGGARVFVKQDAAPAGMLLAREAAWLRSLAGRPQISSLVPRLLAFDCGQGMLATEACTGYVPLDRRLKSSSLADPASAIAAALALAAIHRQPIEGVEPVGFPLGPVEPLTPEEITAQPADYARLAIVLQVSRSAIEALRASWRCSHLIHGDFKASNLLWRVERSLEAQPPLKIVDWEMAGAGDPMWDVGSYIGSILLAWLDAIPGAAADSVRRQIGCFLIAYRHEMPAVTATAFQYAGIFLLHRVMVGLDITGLLDPACSLMLELAPGLLNQPQRAAANLVPGLEP